MLHGMVRPALALMIVALAAPAGAGKLPHRCGMYADPSAALPMLDSSIDVHVRGPIAEATVTQTFRNDSDHVTEATYIFPLPADAAVSAMAIEVGNRTIHAAIARREDAQRRYEDAIAAGLGAGLLDQERADVFTQSVSAIPAHGTVKVTLRFDTTARYGGGAWELALPLVVAPRFVPGTASGRPTTGTGRSPDTDRAPDASRVTPGGAPGAGGATTIAIDFADAVDDVASPSHDLQHDGNRYTFTDAHSDHDAIVRWRAHVPAEGWIEQDDDGGYAAIVVEAPSAKAATPASLVVVLDRAATTRGDADAVEHPLVRALLGALPAAARASFTGSDRVDARPPEQALHSIDDAWPHPPGAFDLTRVLGATRAGGAAIVLVTDGLVADDRAALAAARKVGAPIHVIGVGPAPNRSLLTAIATTTGGTVRFAVAGDDLAALARDVLADSVGPPPPLAVTWGTLSAFDLEPATLPRLGSGQAALVVARVKQVQRANARAGGDVFAFTSVSAPRPPLGATTPKGPIARRWARTRLDELVAAGDGRAIAAHALAYGLVSPATSMIAIGDEVVVSEGVKHTVSVPVSVPAGMRWQEVRHEITVDTKPRDRVATGGEAEKNDKKTKNEPAPHKPDEPKPIATTPSHEHGSKKGVEANDDEDRASDKRPTQTPPPSAGQAAPAEPENEPVREESPKTATIEQGDAGGAVDEEVLITAAAPARTRRLSLELGAGVAVSRGNADFASQLEGRYELGSRTAFGVQGGLWLVGGLNLEGDVLVTAARRRIDRKIDVRGGLGLHLGNGAGPALDFALGVHLVPPLVLLLRYDGALMFHDGTRDGLNTTTIGVEASF
jgi:Ca-activated chloride channel family protein